MTTMSPSRPMSRIWKPRAATSAWAQTLFVQALSLASSSVEAKTGSRQQTLSSSVVSVRYSILYRIASPRTQGEHARSLSRRRLIKPANDTTSYYSTASAYMPVAPLSQRPA